MRTVHRPEYGSEIQVQLFVAPQSDCSYLHIYYVIISFLKKLYNVHEELDTGVLKALKGTLVTRQRKEREGIRSIHPATHGVLIAASGSFFDYTPCSMSESQDYN